MKGLVYSFEEKAKSAGKYDGELKESIKELKKRLAENYKLEEKYFNAGESSIRTLVKTIATELNDEVMAKLSNDGFKNEGILKAFDKNDLRHKTHSLADRIFDEKVKSPEDPTMNELYTDVNQRLDSLLN